MRRQQTPCGIRTSDTRKGLVLFPVSLDDSPTAETLMAETPQNADCFLDKSLDWLLGKSFSDFPKSS
jgi:hypothetical protein